MTRLSDHERAQGGTVTISAEQWDKLIELLTPGYELALMYKAQMEQAMAAPAAPTPANDNAGDQS